ncbi:MAG TPA: M20/M25/M40 family metallo-hydrolase [Chitinophagales bacterium]|nr:M20/M25/M40 family metallo-hydrolase [Chitinophagales bacterium]HRG84065.1 M20/M25/M40 family metallo-hydrolase [Chitinophagales bacterium]HRH52176.1 M20/M25/M40 family metallo-hydrolase [Chitinophagales bacterium]
MIKHFIAGGLSLLSLTVQAQQTDKQVFAKIFDETMLHGEAYDNLHDLCKNIGHRLAGSPQADMAVRWSYELMQSYDLDSVWLQEVMVPHWVRGAKEYGEIINFGQVNMLALGGSIATPKEGIIEQVIEVKDFDELKALGAEKIKGKIVFYNHIFPQNVVNSFDGYGEAGPYRWRGASEASKLGAKAVIIRSVGSSHDDFAHTGSTGFADGVKKVPCAALSAVDADFLHDALIKDPALKFKMVMNCEMLDSVKSYNVIAQITGTQFPNEIIVVGGHLDSWDVGEGAHDDGAGCTQSLEVLRTLKAINAQPKRTIRCIFYMNEENGNMGGKTYGAYAKGTNKEKHIAALESDAGGFSPRGFNIDTTFLSHPKFDELVELMSFYGAYKFEVGHGGTDIGPLEGAGTKLFGLSPDSQRYMDLHHTENDTFDKVNKRELHMGASVMGMLCWWLSEYGVK